MNFENIVVSRGRGISNGKYKLTDNAASVQCKLPQQAFDVLKAMATEPYTIDEIAANADIKTKQSKERIVKYYVPMLLKAGLIEQA
jgi:hypothetical protein